MRKRAKLENVVLQSESEEEWQESEEEAEEESEEEEDELSAPLEKTREDSVFEYTSPFPDPAVMDTKECLSRILLDIRQSHPTIFEEEECLWFQFKSGGHHSLVSAALEKKRLELAALIVHSIHQSELEHGHSHRAISDLFRLGENIVNRLSLSFAKEKV